MLSARVSVSLLHLTTLSPNLMKSSSSPVSLSTTKRFINAAVNDPLPSRIESVAAKPQRWKPMCLYFTHGKCTEMDDPAHLETFNHNCSVELPVNVEDVKLVRPQDLDYVLVLDLEGKVEILEFPVVMINTKTMEFVDLFHRFVRPDKMSQQRVDEYIRGKYGEIGVDRVWHDTAIPFKEVLQQFEIWITNHNLWDQELGGLLHRAAFVT